MGLFLGSLRGGSGGEDSGRRLWEEDGEPASWRNASAAKGSCLLFPLSAQSPRGPFILPITLSLWGQPEASWGAHVFSHPTENMHTQDPLSPGTHTSCPCSGQGGSPLRTLTLGWDGLQGAGNPGFHWREQDRHSDLWGLRLAAPHPAPSAQRQASPSGVFRGGGCLAW